VPDEQETQHTSADAAGSTYTCNAGQNQQRNASSNPSASLKSVSKHHSGS